MLYDNSMKTDGMTAAFESRDLYWLKLATAFKNVSFSVSGTSIMPAQTEGEE